ncbi:hypothetical protein FQA39_LY04515 [Lamprigera yunnana]|nr:hypothetical protein FQA39_LY04515 [Lamprigera yunnana]
MWMLYAEQHWTKAIDLKSAVKRLYEKLGALEFDGDHEAIYGMERYYTVQQCEQLRDKYKIKRNIIKQSKFNVALLNCGIGPLLMFEHLFLLMTHVTNWVCVSEATVHVITALGSVNLEYFFWTAIGNVDGTAPISGLHKR